MPYNVFLVKVVEFPDNGTLTLANGQRESPSQAESIQAGVQARLTQLFAEVSPGDPVHLQWVPVGGGGAIQPQPNELVIYFVNTFMQGMIRPHLEQLRLRARTPELQRDAAREYARALPTAAGRPLPEDGLTYTVHPDHILPGSGAPWVISEVYVGEIIARDFPNLFPRHPAIRDWMDQQRTAVGARIAETAFHEVLHNKLDPNRPAGWDMHRLGGLAAGTGTQMTGATRNQMTQRLHRRLERQYVLGRHTLPWTATPSTPVTSGGGTDLSHVPGR